MSSLGSEHELVLASGTVAKSLLCSCMDLILELCGSVGGRDIYSVYVLFSIGSHILSIKPHF